jgi:hypothetical protein
MTGTVTGRDDEDGGVSSVNSFKYQHMTCDASHCQHQHSITDMSKHLLSRAESQ